MGIVVFPRYLPSCGAIMIMSLLLVSSIAIADIEPNDTKDTAEIINLGQVILGSLDAASDIHDFHNLSLDGGDTIVAILDGPADADYDLGI